MARSSGIGTYLRQVVPLVFRAGSGMSPAMLGDVAELGDLDPGTEALRIPASAPIYSVGEQLELRRRIPRATRAFWSPHYNIPLFYAGPLIVTIHDVLHLARPEYVRHRHQRAYARLMFAAIRRRASAVICDSNFTADELRRLAGVDSGKMHVVHLGVEEAWFKDPGAAVPHPRPYFVYVGNVKPHKNLRRLVRAFGALSDDLPHDLIIIGRRHGFISGDPIVAQEAARLGGRIVFTDHVSDADVRNFVGHADALVLPSLYEGFGLPALEGMAAGCPVIVSRAGSLPEVCGEAGVYIDPESEGQLADAMRRVAMDGQLREDLVEAGRVRARSFTWERCADHTRQILQDAIPRS